MYDNIIASGLLSFFDVLVHIAKQRSDRLKAPPPPPPPTPKKKKPPTKPLHNITQKNKITKKKSEREKAPPPPLHPLS